MTLIRGLSHKTAGRKAGLGALALGVLSLSLSWLLAVALLWIVTGLKLPTVTVRWAEGTTDSQRSSAEAELALELLETERSGTYRYYLADASQANLRAIVLNPLVADTGHINRGSFELDNPPIARRWLGDRYPVFGNAHLLLLSLLGCLAGWVARRRTAVASRIQDHAVPTIFMIGVAIALFVQSAGAALAMSDTKDTFYSLTNGLGEYADFKPAWRPRVFSTGLAAVIVSASTTLAGQERVPLGKTPLELTVGLWTVGWFVVGSLLLLAAFRRRSTFYILGMFAGISFGYSLDARVYPWDLPSLVVFTLFALLFIRKRYLWSLFVIPLGVGFKESAMILCAAYLLADLSWRDRVYWCVGACVLSLAVKVGLDLMVQAPVFLTMEMGAGQGDFATVNLSSLRTLVPFFVNAGTLFAFLLVPSGQNRNIAAFQLVAVLFVAGNLLFGIVTEYRIWFEVIPFALYGLDAQIYGDPLAGETAV